MYNGFVIVLHPTLVQGDFIVYLIHCASTHKPFKNLHVYSSCKSLKSLPSSKCSFVLCKQNMNKNNIQHCTKDFKEF